MFACRSVAATFLLATLFGQYAKCAIQGPVSYYSSSTKCDLPPQPQNGFFSLNNFEYTKRGPVYKAGAYLTYGCYPGFLLEGNEQVECSNGAWVSQPKCEVNVEDDIHSIIRGNTAKAREFPWHVGIYFVKGTSRQGLPQQVCGGTLISDQHVLTAAHCFYKGGTLRLDKRLFIVAADKLHREFIHKDDRSAQYRAIKVLDISDVYEDINGNYADDIALLTVQAPFSIQHYVKPVNIDWNHSGLEIIRPGLKGEVAGWGKTEEGGDNSPILQYLTVPTVDRGQCKEHSPKDFGRYLTYDKFCAGYRNGSNFCDGDSGGGFVTKTLENNKYKYYIRGVVSVGPRKGSSCDALKYTAFTSVLRHLEWLKFLIPNQRFSTTVTTEKPDIFYFE